MYRMQVRMFLPICPIHRVLTLCKVTGIETFSCHLLSRQCGDDHTDREFDVEASTTFHALDCSECKFSSNCNQNKCSVSLSYAEGSRWDAYEVMS